MKPIQITLQAYIPKSLGKSLRSYFDKNILFDRRLLSNYDSFKRELESYDKTGFTWLPEPGSFASDCFFATDNQDFHDKKHGVHTGRLSINLNIKPEKIGRYSLLDKSDVFTHSKHSKSSGNGSQHSDESHRVQAYIKKIAFNMDSPRSSSQDIYMGVITKYPSIRSDESTLEDISISNTYSGYYFTQKNRKPDYDTSVIKASASAPYPYLKYVAPSIDMNITVKAYLNISSKTVIVTIEGEHNKFPAYELLVNNEVLYSYFPKGHSGPTPINLGQSKTFLSTYYMKLSDWDMETLKQKYQKSKSVFGF